MFGKKKKDEAELNIDVDAIVTAARSRAVAASELGKVAGISFGKAKK